MKVHNLVVTGSLQSGGENLTSISSSVASTVTNVSSSVSTSISQLSSSLMTSINEMSSSLKGMMATTGSNVFVGNQTISGSLIPAVNSTYDLGSPTNEFRHLYLSSASLYIDGTKVLGSTTQELQITTDTGQSFKILEAGSDTITLQAADGNITLATSGGGDVILDPTTGIIALKGTTTVYAGNRILSSDGNAIHFGNSVTMTGSLIVTGFIETQELRTTYISSSILYRSGSTKFGDELTDTHAFSGSVLISGSLSVPGSNLVSGSAQITYSGLSGVPSGIVSSSAQLPSGLVSGSSQIDVLSTTNIARLATTGSNTFTGNQTLNNGQYLRGIRNSGALAINLLGIESGSDRTLMTATGDFVIQNGSLTSMLTLTTGGAATFAGRASFSGSTLIGEVQSSYALIETTAGNGIWLRPAGASSPTGLFVNTSGLVGVGISNPTQKLNIDGLRGQPGTTGTIQNGLFRLGTLTNGYGEVMDMGVHVGVSGPSSYSWIQSTNQGSLSVNYNLALNPNGGNVGVGTNAPLAKLDVQGGSDGDGMISMGSNSVSGILNAPANMYINADSDNNSASGVIAFGFNRTGYSGGAEAVRILENGNFGINTTNPTQKLHVAGYIRTNGISVFKTGGSISGFIGHEQDWLGTGTSNDLICASEGGNNFKVFTNGTTDIRMMINTSGNMAIGGTSPSTKLDVGGNIKNAGRVYSGNAVTGNISPNLNPANTRNYILVCDLNDIAGFSMNGFMNAASYTCWNMSSFYIMKNYSSTTASAGITGQYKAGGCDMNIVDLSYGGGRYIAIGYTSNPEIDVIWTGYRLTHMLNSDGSAQVIAQSSVTVNSTLATY